MKVSFIIATSDRKWTADIVDVPAATFPDKLHRGSAKWTKKAIAFIRGNYSESELEEIGYIGVLNANPDGEE